MAGFYPLLEVIHIDHVYKAFHHDIHIDCYLLFCSSGSASANPPTSPLVLQC